MNFGVAGELAGLIVVPMANKVSDRQLEARGRSFSTLVLRLKFMKEVLLGRCCVAKYHCPYL